MYILITNIRKMLKKPFIILLLIFMSAIAVTIIGLSYGILMTVQDNRKEQTVINKVYGIELGAMEDIIEFDRKIMPLLDIVGEEFDYMYCEGHIGQTSLGMVYCGSNSDYSGTAFTFEQLYRNEKVADAHYETTGAEVGDIVDIGGVEFKIKDNDKESDTAALLYCDYRIPYASAPANVKVYVFNLILKSMPSERLNDDISNYITANFQTREFNPPQIIDAETEQRRSFSFVACIAMALILCFCLSYVYLYLIHKRKMQIGILIMCGCEPEKANNIFTFEILIYTAIGGILSLPCLMLLIKLFDNIFFDFSKSYDYKIFIILIIGYLLLTTLILAAFLRSLIKATVNELQKGAM